MIEKRSFVLGFIIHKISGENITPGTWINLIETYCKKFNMTVPDETERKDLADFMEYLVNIWERKSN